MPGFALDASVVGELLRRRPDPRVLRWVEGRMAGDLFLPACVFGELVRGVCRRPEGDPWRARHAAWIERDLARQFRDRILAFDADAARIWGEIVGSAERDGAPVSPAEARIAALARRHDLVLATCDEGRFRGMGADLLDPRSAGCAGPPSSGSPG